VDLSLFPEASALFLSTPYREYIGTVTDFFAVVLFLSSSLLSADTATNALPLPCLVVILLLSAQQVYAVLRIQIRDPGYEIRRLFDPRIWDPGWVKNQDTDSGSKMNNPYHISESLESIFWVKIFFAAVQGWKKFGSGINIPDPQH
jgi:hypothetical protein